MSGRSMLTKRFKRTGAVIVAIGEGPIWCYAERCPLEGERAFAAKG